MGEYDQFTPDTLGKGYPAKLGLQFSKADVFPTATINNYYSLGGGLKTKYKEKRFDISDQLTLIRGRHLLHFGGEAVIFRADSTAWGNIYGANVGFSGVYTAGSNTGSLASTTGSSYADFLLGYVQNWSAVVSPEYGGRLKNSGVFVQDDFKVTPKLTLNLGLRWEGNTGWSEVYGNARSFDPNVINPATNAPASMWYAITHANGRNRLQKGVWNNWLPRFGFAYLLGTKTMIRGGFGMYTFPWNVDTTAAVWAMLSPAAATRRIPPATCSRWSSSRLTETPITRERRARPSMRSYGRYHHAGSLQRAGGRLQSVHLAVTAPQILELHHSAAMNGSTVLDVGYVGSNQSHLPFTTDLNQVPENKLGPNDAAFRPYPFQTISGNTTDGISNYHAFQTGITRRFTRGLMFNFNYTWSHMLTNQDSSGGGSLQGATPYQRAYDPMANYGPSNFDIRHMFKGHMSYDLPFGRGRRFADTNKALDLAIGGWTLFGDFVAQGGSPFTPSMLVNNSYSLSSNALWYPNVVGDPTAVAARASIPGSTSMRLRPPRPAHLATWGEMSCMDRN